jgi:DNA-binding IclR family transcriptional regulator
MSAFSTAQTDPVGAPAGIPKPTRGPKSLAATARSLAPAVDNAFCILDCLGRHPGGIGLSDIARELGISKSSCFNILTTMLRIGAVERRGTSVTWHLGPKLVELGTATRRGYSGRAAVRSELQALADVEKLVCVVGQVLGGHAGIVVLDRVYPHSPGEWVNVPIGEVYPISVPAMGRAVLAAYDEEEAREILARSKVPKDKHAELLASLGVVRSAGYSLAQSEYKKGIHAVATLVPNFKADPSLAICLVGNEADLPPARLTRLGDTLKRTAREVAGMLGQERGWA